MNTEFMIRMAVITAILVAIDLYVFKGIKVLIAQWDQGLGRQLVVGGYWVISVGLLVAVNVTFFRISLQEERSVDYSSAFYLFGILLMVYMPKLVFSIFHLVEDLAFLGTKGVKAAVSSEVSGGEQISRFTFLSQVGAGLAAVPFVGVAYGMLKGRFDFKVRKETLAFKNLPKSFDGLKVVQISDLHLGSFFSDFKSVQKGIDMINALEPDVLLFTGDLVNNYAVEAKEWVPVFRSLKAKMGKFSVLGNHDYGDYVPWPDADAKRKNVESVVQMNKDMGFRILMNEREELEINGEKIGILGVENYGKPPFPQHGDLKKSLAGGEDLPFKLLLSHDPSHWDMQVLDTDIDLTLSGHTHGMQFGVEVGGIKWSPVKMKYPRWGGLYQEGKQFLYVNRGFGYIGFPGRVGMPPEITLLELRSA